MTEENHLALFGNLQISSPDNNPRSFPYGVKQQCWEKAEKIKGREPDRWRRDFLRNTVFRKLVGCPGCLEYDHIIPYSKVLNYFQVCVGLSNVCFVGYSWDLSNWVGVILATLNLGFLCVSLDL